ncbi:cGMP-dependent protein kinase 1 [Condylostylus longicornis]|uniref:cGMP-dependent protein kinase 1 n=1 Tax=Condylostylus longicornis TaxID=2530218 RepID=UPI00244E35C7|nr:cGMP-dependent protein kinase 1 [Condylostylus longicornis]
MACIRKLFTKCNGFNPTPIVSPTAANKTTIIENSNANTGRYTLHSERSEYPKQNELNSSTSSPISTRKNNGKNGSHGRDSGVQVDEPENQHKHHQQHQQLDITKIKQSSDDSSSGNGNNRSISSNSNRTDTGRSSNTPQDSRGKTSILNPEESDENLRKGLIFHRRSDNKEAIDIPIFEKDKEIRTLITKAIEKNDFLNNYMDKERKKRVIDAMEPEFYDKGEFIIKENEEGSEIYVSEMGEFEVIKNNKILTTLGPGIVFGELAILYNAKRFASIRAKTKAKVWKIDRTKFRTIMLISGSEERKENLKFLKSAPFLEELSDEVLLRVCELLKRKFFPTDTRIIRQGDKGDLFFIIRGGSVTIKKTDENGQERIVDRRKREQYFGEQALLNCDQRLASVYADPPGTECLILDREAFINYLGTIAELKKKPKDRDIQPDIKIPSSQFDFIKLKDLKKVTCLGAGAFGVVDLVTYNEKFSFALKVIKKIDVIKQGQIDHIYNEKLVMSICRNSPFIIELYNTFRDTKYVYFLMEACLGGDVWTIMYQRKFFDEKTARFISGCVVEAFDFLHTRNIIYRDLKPENLMVTPDGYCKLVDFGFAKRLVTSSKTNTFAGTPEYVAPEIILDRGHDRAVDYWALGILIYELLAGRTPFRGTNQMKIYQQILTGIDAVKMSAKITKHAQNLIKSLCKQTPAERLGYQRRGILDIKKHSWYDGFDWNKLRNRQMSSPIKRPINSYIDTQYFPTKFENDGSDPPVEMSGWDDEF